MSLFDNPRSTIGEFIEAVRSIQNHHDARTFYEEHVRHLMQRYDYTHEKAIETARSNIGWCYGEGMSQDRVTMWVESTGAKHPMFGVRLPTPEEAFRMGQDAMERHLAGKKTDIHNDGKEPPFEPDPFSPMRRIIL